MLIERLPDQRLDHCLAAHTEVLRSLIQFLQHGGRDVYVEALNRLTHSALAFEEMKNILAMVREARDCVGGKRLGRLASVLLKRIKSVSRPGLATFNRLEETIWTDCCGR